MNYKRQVSDLTLNKEALLEELSEVKAINQKLLLEIDFLKKERDKYKYDHLTGMMGRVDFEEQFKSFYNDFIKQGKDFIFGIIDINNLHSINRDGGYEAGDNLIKLVSTALKETFPDSLLYRIGGDEFTVLCRKIDNTVFVSINQNFILKKNITYSIISVSEIFKDRTFTKQELFKYVDKLIINKKLNNNQGRRSSD